MKSAVVNRLVDRIKLLRRRAARKRTFTRIFETKAWGSNESASGIGSTLEQTEALRELLPGLLVDLNVDVLVDVPCGDWFWLQHVQLPVSRYIGLDVVEAVIERNVAQHAAPGRTFKVGDLTHKAPPRADLVLCRDLLVHLSDEEIRAALRNIRASGSTWLLTTTFTQARPHTDIETGSWRPLNLEREPWNFPPPARLFNEHCTVDDGRWLDKSLGLWPVLDIPLEP